MKKESRILSEKFSDAAVFFAFHFAQDWRLGLNSAFFFLLGREVKVAAFFNIYCRMAIMGDAKLRERELCFYAKHFISSRVA